MFTLAHLTDPHLGPLRLPRASELLSKRGLGYINWLRKRRAIHQPDVLAALVADLKQQKPDHIAVTGDLANLSLDSEYAFAKSWLDGLGTGRDVTVVPGNHDCYVRTAIGSSERHWSAHMSGDAGESFPFVRRRGPLALIGLSTSLPTWPFAATGRLIGEQLARLPAILERLADEKLFRVVLIHHPPIPNVHRFRRLADDGPLRELLRKSGAELVLHGHLHEAKITWLSGPRSSIPCVGAPSASASPQHEDEPAGYNLYAVDGQPGAWRCTAISRGFSREHTGIAELMRTELADQ